MRNEADILHALLACLRSPVGIYDSDGKLLYESRAMREMRNKDAETAKTDRHFGQDGSGLDLILPSGERLWMTELEPSQQWIPEQLLDALPDAVWWRRSGLPTQFSSGFRKLYGYPLKGSLPSTSERMDLVHHDDRKRVQQMI